MNRRNVLENKFEMKSRFDAIKIDENESVQIKNEN